MVKPGKQYLNLVILGERDFPLRVSIEGPILFIQRPLLPDQDITHGTFREGHYRPLARASCGSSSLSLHRPPFSQQPQSQCRHYNHCQHCPRGTGLLEGRDHFNSSSHTECVLDNASRTGEALWHNRAFKERHNGLTIFNRLALVSVGQRQGITGQLLVGAHPAEGIPHERVEPVNCTQQHNQPVDPDIPLFHMREFMQKDIPQTLCSQ